jgi:hypothetical protein
MSDRVRDLDLGGSFALGPWRVHRAGYGAMQLAGDGVFGPPRDPDEAVRVLRTVESTTSTPRSTTDRER